MLALKKILGWLGLPSNRMVATHDLLLEMMTNAERALIASSTGAIQKFEDSAWQRCRPVLAHVLDVEEINKILTAYSDALNLAAFEKDCREMRETAARLGLEFVAALRAFEKQAFRRGERRSFEAILARLEHRLQTSVQSSC